MAHPDKSLKDKFEATLNLLKSVFFLLPSLANLDDIKRYEYLQSNSTPSIMRHKIRLSIKQTFFLSAFSCNLIPYKIKKYSSWDFWLAREDFHDVKLLSQLFAPFYYNYFFEIAQLHLRWFLSDSLSAYCTTKHGWKSFENYFTSQISFLSTEYNLLAVTHFRTQIGWNQKNSVHYLFEKTLLGWNRRQESTAIFLDISRAFDNISHERLIHNIKKQKLDPPIVN